jgi:hypothetical protein
VEEINATIDFLAEIVTERVYLNLSTEGTNATIDFLSEIVTGKIYLGPFCEKNEGDNRLSVRNCDRKSIFKSLRG